MSSKIAEHLWRLFEVEFDIGAPLSINQYKKIQILYYS
ncbi:hypothetical protein NIES4071_72050 [Calothrix sp. NIES-4071]|nr:hypothetical protein NIES4071_72050 [Calothrix sp. NIES-4071]BAZ61480.1 hypothetical protein NIES4105_72000 [Calothrix sp. NIES-4105]